MLGILFHMLQLIRNVRAYLSKINKNRHLLMVIESSIYLQHPYYDRKHKFQNIKSTERYIHHMQCYWDGVRKVDIVKFQIISSFVLNRHQLSRSTSSHEVDQTVYIISALFQVKGIDMTIRTANIKSFSEIKCFGAYLCLCCCCHVSKSSVHSTFSLILGYNCENI